MAHTDPVTTDDAADPTRITITTGDGQMPARLIWPGDDPGNRPVVVLVQEIFGITPYMLRRARDLAGLGYDVVVPEVYWRLGEGIEFDDRDPASLEQAMGTVQRLDWEQAVADVEAAVFAAKAMGDGRVGLVGFCFGGGLAFNVAAVERPDVLVCYYGSALPQLLELADRVDMPSLHHFGDSDSFIPLETVEQIRDAVTVHETVEFHVYPGADHAFDGTLPNLHHEDASAQAWDRTAAFLGEHLRTG